MDKRFDLARAFARDAALLRLARESAMLIHPTDVRAAGNEVEKSVRDYFRRILPPRYYVTSGHLIDCDQRVSPQIDIIIADAFNLPSLYTTQDGTEYVPTTSVFAIGEVKSTYYKSGAYFQEFGKSLAKIACMHRPLTENTAYGGELRGDTTLLDMVRGSKNKVLNHLFSFLFCVDAGDFSFEDVASHFNSTNPALLPNVTVLLNDGALSRTRINEGGEGKYHKYPTEAPSPEYGHVACQPYAKTGRLGGRPVLRGCLKTDLSCSWREDCRASKVAFHEQAELSKRPERPTMAATRTTAASSQTGRPTNQVPASGSDERYSLCVAYRVRVADASSRPASLAHHIPLLSHLAARWDLGEDS